MDRADNQPPVVRSMAPYGFHVGSKAAFESKGQQVYVALNDEPSEVQFLATNVTPTNGT
jgi:hypothetical protein